MTDTARYGAPAVREPSEADIEIDQHGCPVTLEPADWLVLFVPGLRKQWWHPLVHVRHKHCFLMRPGGAGGYIVVEPWWTRMMISTLTAAQARKFLLWGARGDVLLARENIPGAGSQVRGWMTCAALTAYLLGRSYPVWTPHGLYRRLLREPGVRRVNPLLLLQGLGAEHFRPHVHSVREAASCQGVADAVSGSDSRWGALAQRMQAIDMEHRMLLADGRTLACLEEQPEAVTAGLLDFLPPAR